MAPDPSHGGSSSSSMAMDPPSRPSQPPTFPSSSSSSNSNSLGTPFSKYRQSTAGVPDTPANNNNNSASHANTGTGTGNESTSSSSRPPPPASPFFRRTSGEIAVPPPMLSPWHHLAATSGAPTPALERPGSSDQMPFSFGNLSAAQASRGFFGASNASMAGGGSTTSASSSAGSSSSILANALAGNTAGSRSHSPHLGNPFEKLNLGSGGGMANGTANADPFASSFAESSLARRRGSREGMSGAALQLPAGAASAAAASGSSSSTAAQRRPIKSPSPLASSSSASSSRSAGGSSTSLQPLTPAALSDLLSRAPDTTLMLDLRPPSAYVAGHIACSLSVPIPSTLLKRATFTLNKLAEMLPPASASELRSFRTKNDVVIIDQDSSFAAKDGVLQGLANKLAQESFEGHVWFLRGGIAESQRQPGLSLVEGEEDSEMSGSSGAEDGFAITLASAGGSGRAAPLTSRSLPIPANRPGTERQPSSLANARAGRIVGGLDRLAFSAASAQGMGGGAGNGGSGRRMKPPGTLTLPKTPGVGGFGSSSSGGGSGSGMTLRAQADAAVRHDLTPRKRAHSTSAAELQPANPFFDNIRQNLELSHGGITERIPLALPEEIQRRSAELPPFLREIVEEPEDVVATRLAHEFESIERDEQQRLQGIMDWHTRGSRQWCDEDQRKLEDGFEYAKEQGAGEEYFPFSITAGVERGSKNRYKNIWPYDFSRVRLGEPSEDDGSDYINANFIQPPGTTKRYIATQGPLDATYRDFWTLVWEQGVHAIVMLTKQLEGGSIKCGSYWTGGQYGPLKLELISSEGGSDHVEPVQTGFDFGTTSDKPEASTPNIKRVFSLTNTAEPEAAPRKVVQIQCVSWPDFDVPEDPRVLLGLIKEVDGIVEETQGESAEKPPVLVHCSAGVGRTGSFIVVDALLEALRREYQLKWRKISGSGRRSSVTSSIDFSISLNGERKSDATQQPPPPSTPAHEAKSGSGGFVDLVTDMNRAAKFAPDRNLTREPTPISGMETPVRHILAGIRRQRMSLCQSLRQYIFVYRSVITGFLDLVDEERRQDGSAATTDDEGHIKRRASPTELSGASLQKRPSIKLRRSDPDASGRRARKEDDGASAFDISRRGSGVPSPLAVMASPVGATDEDLSYFTTGPLTSSTSGMVFSPGSSGPLGTPGLGMTPQRPSSRMEMD